MNRELVMDVLGKLEGVGKDKLYLLNDLVLQCNDSYLALGYLKLGGVNSLSMKELFFSNLSSCDDIKLAIEYVKLFEDNSLELTDSDILRLEDAVIENIDLLEFYIREFDYYDGGNLFDRLVMTKDIDIIDRYIRALSNGDSEDIDNYLWILVDRYLDEYKMIRVKDMDKACCEAKKSYMVMDGIINRYIDKLDCGEGLDKVVLFSLITGNCKANIESFSSLVSSDVALVYLNWENRMIDRDFFIEAIDSCVSREFDSDMFIEVLSKLYGRYSLEDINKLYDSYFAGTVMDMVYKDFVMKYAVVMDSLLELRRVKKR